MVDNFIANYFEFSKRKLRVERRQMRMEIERVLLHAILGVSGCDKNEIIFLSGRSIHLQEILNSMLLI